MNGSCNCWLSPGLTVVPCGDTREQAPVVLSWGGFFRGWNVWPTPTALPLRVPGFLRLRNPRLNMAPSQPQMPLRHQAPYPVSRSPLTYRLMAVVVSCGLLAMLGLLVWQLATV